MLHILHSHRTLRLRTAGRLLPWLGPALRGLIAGNFKRAVCRYSLAEQNTTRKHCKGCPYLHACPYGRTVEGEPLPHTEAFKGQDDGTRPFVLSPRFPLPERAQPGMLIGVEAIFIGNDAASEVARFWESAVFAGYEGGLGNDRIGFDVEDGPDCWDYLDLPRDPTAVSGSLPLVRVEFSSPLFMRQGATEVSKRHMNMRPTFGDLLRAGLRTLGALGRGYGSLLEVDFAALREAGEKVPTLHESYRSFRQGKWSNRSQQSGQVVGVVGAAEFGPVPVALARWVAAAGRVHVGLHRVAGAGGWWTLWSPDRGETWCEL